MIVLNITFYGTVFNMHSFSHYLNNKPKTPLPFKVCNLYLAGGSAIYKKIIFIKYVHDDTAKFCN